MNPKVKKVKPLEDNFWSGLKDIEIFKTVQVSGGSIEWLNNGVPYRITWDDVDILNYEFEQNEEFIAKQENN